MFEQRVESITDIIVRKFKPQKVVLFGSYAWGNPQKNSDLDLLIVKDDQEKNTREMAIDVERILSKRDVPLDILVYKPDQIARRLADQDPFISKIWRKGKVLYEQ